MAVDIRGVAEAAGVSVSTVSLALNNKGRVSAKTRQHVMETARRLGYFPNSHARGLRGSGTALVGLQIGHAAASTPVTDSAFTAALINGASRAALQQGWLLVVIPPDTTPDLLEKTDIRQAIILDPSGEEALLSHIRDSGGHAVLIGRPIRDDAALPPGAVSVIDYTVAPIVRAGLDHLYDSGYRRPALLTVNYPSSYIADTIAAFRTWALDKRIPSVIASSQKLDIAASAAIARDMLQVATPPDAIYTTNEEGALGVLQAARQLGLKLPGDLGLITTTNGQRVQQSDPTVTAVDLYPDRIGETAIAALRDLAEGKGVTHIAPPIFELKIRQSTLQVSFEHSESTA